jgi:alkanesulfonate monooxygenase SsuD/methylene tetrahydromethanopterin reductase-like flavin-dependent oxidoreductase (luciferase family)
MTRRGFAVFAGLPTDIIRACARQTESARYDSFWVNHPGATDGLAVLGHAARETTRAALGVGVIPLHTRGVDSIADGVRANALPLDRLLLGVGSPNPRSLDRVREGVAGLRARVSTRIVIAALGPKMCRLAGEVADGVLFNWLTPEYARASAALVREGAAAAGRPVPALYGYVRVAIGDAAGDRLRQEGARYDSVPAYHAHFERMGVKPVDTGIAVATAGDVGAALARWEGALDEVVVRAITANDSLDEHLALVQAAKPS